MARIKLSERSKTYRQQHEYKRRLIKVNDYKRQIVVIKSKYKKNYAMSLHDQNYLRFLETKIYRIQQLI